MVTRENQIQGTLQSDRVPAVILNSSTNQCQNFITGILAPNISFIYLNCRFYISYFPLLQNIRFLRSNNQIWFKRTKKLADFLINFFKINLEKFSFCDLQCTK